MYLQKAADSSLDPSPMRAPTPVGSLILLAPLLGLAAPFALEALLLFHPSGPLAQIAAATAAALAVPLALAMALGGTPTERQARWILASSLLTGSLGIGLLGIWYLFSFASFSSYVALIVALAVCSGVTTPILVALRPCSPGVVHQLAALTALPALIAGGIAFSQGDEPKVALAAAFITLAVCWRLPLWVAGVVIAGIPGKALHLGARLDAVTWLPWPGIRRQVSRALQANPAHGALLVRAYAEHTMQAAAAIAGLRRELARASVPQAHRLCCEMILAGASDLLPLISTPHLRPSARRPGRLARIGLRLDRRESPSGFLVAAAHGRICAAAATRPTRAEFLITALSEAAELLDRAEKMTPSADVNNSGGEHAASLFRTLADLIATPDPHVFERRAGSLGPLLGGAAVPQGLAGAVTELPWPAAGMPEPERLFSGLRLAARTVGLPPWNELLNAVCDNGERLFLSRRVAG